MTVSLLLREYDLSIDDIRWYLSHQVSTSLLEHARAPEELVRRIWSGALESELYNMEERFMKRLQDDADRGLTDEQALREHFEQARILKLRRRP